MSPHGGVAALWRYPVKSLQGEPLDRAVVGRRGLAGDRAWGVRDAASGAIMSAKREPRLLLLAAAAAGEGVVLSLPGTAAVTGADADAAVSDFLGRRVTVDLAPDTGPAYVDAAAFHLLSVADLGAWDLRRFRPNVLIDIDVDLETLVGARLQLGSAVVEVEKRTKRCAMTTAAQPGIAKDVGVLRALAAERGLCLGVYARVLRPGVIVTGDNAEPL